MAGSRFEPWAQRASTSRARLRARATCRFSSIAAFCTTSKATGGEGAATANGPLLALPIDVDVGAELAPDALAAMALADVLGHLRILARLLGHLTASALERRQLRQVGGRGGLGQLAALDHEEAGQHTFVAGPFVTPRTAPPRKFFWLLTSTETAFPGSSLRAVSFPGSSLRR
eukprot:4417522-Prymnesium_polylepis.1